MRTPLTESGDGAAGGLLHVPDVLPIFPLPKTVLLPGEVLPLHIFESRYREMVRDALATHRVIGMVQIEPGHEREQPGDPPVAENGCVGLIVQHQELGDGRYLLWLVGLERFHVDEELTVATGYRQVRVTYTPVAESSTELAGLQPLRTELRSLLPDMVASDDEDTGSELRTQLEDFGDDQLVAVASQILELGADRKQQILEASTHAARFMMVFEDLYTHMEIQPGLGGNRPGQLN